MHSQLSKESLCDEIVEELNFFLLNNNHDHFIGVTTDLPSNKESRPQSEFPLDGKTTAVELKLSAEFCVSFDILVKYLPDVLTSDKIMSMTSSHNGEIFRFGISPQYNLLLRMQNNGTVIEDRVAKDIFSAQTLGL